MSVHRQINDNKSRQSLQTIELVWNWKKIHQSAHYHMNHTWIYSTHATRTKQQSQMSPRFRTRLWILSNQLNVARLLASERWEWRPQVTTETSSLTSSCSPTRGLVKRTCFTRHPGWEMHLLQCKRLKQVNKIKWRSFKTVKALEIISLLTSDSVAIWINKTLRLS